MLFDKVFGTLNHVKKNGTILNKGTETTKPQRMEIREGVRRERNPDELNPPEAMKYEGTLEDVLSKTERLDENSAPLDKLFYPPRITRGVLDHAIANRVPGEERIEKVTDSIQICKEAYRENYRRVEEAVKRFRDENQDLLSERVNQEVDIMSWNAYKSTSIQTNYDNKQTIFEGVRHTFEKGEEKPLFILGIAHGGLLPAVELHNTVEETKGMTSDGIYTFRASFRKQGDKQVRITEEENEFIKEQARDSTTLLIDEDMWSGKTISEAEDHLQNLGIDYSTIVYDGETSFLDTGRAETLRNHMG